VKRQFHRRVQVGRDQTHYRGGHLVADVSKRLSVSTHSLYGWMKKYADLAPNFYPVLSSLRRLIMPFWARVAMAMGA
jgi:transposase